MNINLLKEIIAKVGGDVENLPDNLLTTHLKALCEALGVDTSEVPDNLITTYLKAMHKSEVPDNLMTTHLEALCSTLGIDTSDMEDRLASSYFERIVNGEISGGGSSGGGTYADQLYEFYGVDKGVYPYITIVVLSNVKATTYLGLIFSKTANNGDFTDALVGESKIYNDVAITLTSAELFVQKVQELFAKDSLVTKATYSSGDYANRVFCTNYDFDVTLGTLYRLDE